jgi:hypothetical protein
MKTTKKRRQLKTTTSAGAGICICVTHEHSDATRIPGNAMIRTQETGFREDEPLSCWLMTHRA